MCNVEGEQSSVRVSLGFAATVPKGMCALGYSREMIGNLRGIGWKLL